MAWLPSRVKEENYLYELSRGEISELDAALMGFKDLRLDGDKVCRENFSLPSLDSKLQILAKQLYEELGFFVLRGLDPLRYTPGDNLVLFLGIASYIGRRLGKQNRRNEAITHIIDTATSTVPPEKRHGVHTNLGIPFHTEVFCEIFALQMRQAAARGGHTLLSPSWTIYNELLRNHPDVISELISPQWPAQIPRSPPTNLRPLLFCSHGKVILNVDPGPLQRIAGDPEMGIDPLTPAQLDALDIVLNLAQKHHMAVNMQPGDILFVNNLSNMHSREPFEDEGHRKRHLLRLWLHNEDLSWNIPKGLQSSWDAIYAHCGGMADMVFPVEPKAYYKPPRISTTTASACLMPAEDDSDLGNDSDTYDSDRD
jgi:hypothetical protein